MIRFYFCIDIVNNVWTGSAGEHFEEYELRDAQACILREMKEELGIDEKTLKDFITIYNIKKDKRRNKTELLFFCQLKIG